MWKKAKGGFLLGIGYLLSPLSWWNDVFFNLPIAYLFGYLVSWFAADLFLPATVMGYWISNILGIVLMQIGAMDMLVDAGEKNLKRDLLVGLGTSTLYTLIVAALVYFHILEAPSFLVG